MPDMKILILANNDVGLYKFRKELIIELLQEHEVFVCLPKGEYINKLKKIGAKYIPCELLDRHGTNPVKEIRLLNYYNRLLKKLKPDKVLTYTIKPNVYGGMACALKGIPYIVNITGLGTALENAGIMQKITLMLYRAGIRKAQMVFFQNRENQKFMISNGVVKGRYDLLPGSGVNLEEYRVLKYPEGKEIHFLFIARVMKEKGIDQYLKAAQIIRKKYPDTRFHVCGACEQDYKGILDKLHNEGVIIYHGLVDDMIAMQEISSCTIHPTYYPEGLSNVLLESCACGRPIITTNRSGCREIVDDGINGFVVKEKDTKELVSVIEKFLALSNEERRKMGMAGRGKVEREFDRKIVVEKYIREIRI